MKDGVIVVGGGPVGLMVASELALANIKVCLLERLKDTTPYSRALTIHPRTLEILDMRGLAPELLEKGRPIPKGHFAGLATPLDFSVLDSASNYTLVLAQSETEKLLEERARGLGVAIIRETEVKSIRQHDEGVEVTALGAEGEYRLTAAYVVGADGGGSLVRKQMDIAFLGTDATFTCMLGDVKLPELEAGGIVSHFTEQGGIMIVPVTKQIHRVIVFDSERMAIAKDEPVTLGELKSSMLRVYGQDFGIREAQWLSRFGNATRQAEHFRKNRVFLAGDAAHIHLPAGGQGMNVGLQEAVNLGWKLAAELNGWAPDWLLDSYHEERYPVSTALLRNTEAQALLIRQLPGVVELRKLMASFLQIPEANALLAAQISAFDVGYAPDPHSPPHPLNGRRFSELTLRLASGSLLKSYKLMHAGSYVLLHLASDPQFGELVAWEKYPHVEGVQASIAEAAVGWENVHTALIRPDGYIAWAVDCTESAPLEAVKAGLARWCEPGSISLK
ncbi:monooxygenase [Paenibacillus sp. KS-LC4]|uniref:monooxygenase n=1 Tax=Paenibacillus sp. KS-LC4 TaxID=2979727 RepID=UPI0030D626A5